MTSEVQLVAPHTAGTVACERCGASFPLQALSAVVSCPYCRHAQQLSQHHLAQLATYRAQVGAQHAEADVHAQYVEGWRRWYGDDGAKPSFGAKTFFLLFFGAAILAGGVGTALAALGLVEWAMLPAIVMMGGFFPAMIVFYGLYFYRLARGGDVKAERAGAVPVACPSCGAPGQLTAGEALDHCRHCRAPLVPTRAIMDQAIDAARQARRRAAITRYRMERDAMVQVYSQGSGSWATYLILGSFGFVLTVPTILFTAEFLSGKTNARPEGLAILWLFMLGLWGAMALIFLFRRDRRQRTRAVLDHLAHQFHGQRLDDIRSVATWLNQLWAGPYGIEQFYVGASYGAAALRVGPYLALLDYCPDGPEHVKRRVQLLVAAWVPGASEGVSARLPPEASPLVQELEREGWSVALEEGGIVVRASEALTKHLRRPEALHAVAPVLDRAVRIAGATGCQPVLAI